MIRKRFENSLSYLEFEGNIENGNEQKLIDGIENGNKQKLKEIKPNEDQDIGQYFGYQFEYQNEQIKVRQFDKNTYMYYFIRDQQWFNSQTLYQIQGGQQIIQYFLDTKEKAAKSIKIIFFNPETKSKYAGKLTQDTISQESRNLLDVQNVLQYLQQHIEYLNCQITPSQDGSCQIAMQIQVDKIIVPLTFNLNQIQLENEELLKIEVVELKKEMVQEKQSFEQKLLKQKEELMKDLQQIIKDNLAEFEHNIKQQQQNFNLQHQKETEQKLKNQGNQISNLKEDQEKVQNDLSSCAKLNQQLKQAFKINEHHIRTITPYDFRAHDSTYQMTNLYSNSVVELSLKLWDEEIPSTIIVLRDGDMSFLNAPARAFYFSFPSGQFRRGEGEVQQMENRFINYPFKKRDLIQLKVDPFSHFITVKVNDYFFPPIKIPSDFLNFAFLLKLGDKGEQRIEEAFKRKKVKIE